MDILHIIVGIFMIGMGFLVKSSPNVIAGYNTMPKDKKKNVDIIGLSTYMRNGLITMGLSIIVGYYFFKWIGLTMISNFIILIVTFVGVTILVIGSQRFDHNKNKTKRTKLTYFILGFVILSLIGLLTYGYIPTKTILDNDTVQFTGMYGFEINVSEIESIEIVDNIPNIKIRTNGFSFGAVNKGFFNLDKFGKTRLLLHSNKSPFLIITLTSGDKIIINYRDKTETEQIFDKLKTMI